MRSFSEDMAELEAGLSRDKLDGMRLGSTRQRIARTRATLRSKSEAAMPETSRQPSALTPEQAQLLDRIEAQRQRDAQRSKR